MVAFDCNNNITSRISEDDKQKDTPKNMHLEVKNLFWEFADLC